MKVGVVDRMLRDTRIVIRDYVPEHPLGASLLWVHGGGFAGGSIDMPESDAVARTLAAAGRHVRTVAYRLAPAWPEDGPLRLAPSPNRYPAAQEDVSAAFLDLLDHGPAFLGGASAGACIAASVAVKLRNEDRPSPTGLVLAYGVFHSKLPAPAAGHAFDSPIAVDSAAAEWFERMTMNYAGTRERLRDPLVFPGEGEPVGLPQTLILDAQRDPLRASSHRFAEQLRQERVRTTEVVIRDSGHGFLNNPQDRGFDRGMRAITKWLQEEPFPVITRS